jgi:hypothetical protein
MLVGPLVGVSDEQSKSRQPQLFKERKNTMKIKTNVKAGETNGEIHVGG